jgi:hypothetical protein
MVRSDPLKVLYSITNTHTLHNLQESKNNMSSSDVWTPSNEAEFNNLEKKCGSLLSNDIKQLMNEPIIEIGNYPHNESSAANFDFRNVLW